jgi:hypothetical protein
MDRRDFLATVAALPLIQLPPWQPSDGLQELVLPNDLAHSLERNCSFPLEQRVVRADEAARIADEIDSKFQTVCVSATDMYSDDWKLDYTGWSWFYTGKRWKQLSIVKQIANAGEFNIAKKDQYFVLQTTRCRLPSFRTSERRLLVDFNDDMHWSSLGGGWPSFIQDNNLIFMRADWFILAIDVFGVASKREFFEDDVLQADITMQLANRLMQPDIDPDPWPGMGFGWEEIAAWLAKGDALFLPFPKQPMI